MRGGGSSVEGARVEVEEHAADKFDGTAVDKLIVFLVVSLLVTRFHGNLRAWQQPRAGGLRRGCDPSKSTFAPSLSDSAPAPAPNI